MLYAAGTLSLACLEILVHLDKAELPPDFVWSSAIIPNEPKLLEIENFPDLLAFRLAGREWVETASELAVMVRSVVIRKEFNVLLSPTHPDYRRMVWSDAKPFRFDPRLFAFE